MQITDDLKFYAQQLNDVQRSHVRPLHSTELYTRGEANTRGQVQPARWPRLLSRRQVAEYLSVSESTVSKWVREGELLAPRSIPGRLARWDKRELDRFLDVQDAERRRGGPRISDLLEGLNDCSGKEVG